MLAAASYLSINDFRNTIVCLVRANETYLAYYLAKYYYKEALAEVASLLAERSERFF